jgi:hypothetical protein
LADIDEMVLIVVLQACKRLGYATQQEQFKALEPDRRLLISKIREIFIIQNPDLLELELMIRFLANIIESNVSDNNLNEFFYLFKKTFDAERGHASFEKASPAYLGHLLVIAQHFRSHAPDFAE